MKKNLLLIFSLFCCFNTAILSAKEQAFKGGEKLEYRISYGFIQAGSVVFETRDSVFEGNKVFHSCLTAKTIGIVDKIYRLYDVYESFYDKENHLPIYSIANIKEGKYRYYDETSYYQQDLKAKSKKQDSILLLERASFDVLSALNYIRNLDWTTFEENQMLEIPVFHEARCFLMLLSYKGKREVQVGDSNYKAHLFTPQLPEGDLIRGSKEKMTFWFSDDDNKIPILIKFDLAVGSYRLSLVNYENLLHPLKSKMK